MTSSERNRRQSHERGKPCKEHHGEGHTLAKDGEDFARNAKASRRSNGATGLQGLRKDLLEVQNEDYLLRGASTSWITLRT